ncbi:hypothetical protein D9M71_528000 [compost metagenome]
MVGPSRQYCSRSLAQASQVRHESTMQPTPTRSPTLCVVTLSPTAVTRPMISWPGISGYTAMPHSLRAWWMSEWHTPQYRISMATSSGRGLRRSKFMGARGLVGVWAA